MEVPAGVGLAEIGLVVGAGDRVLEAVLATANVVYFQAITVAGGRENVAVACDFERVTTAENQECEGEG